MEDFTDVMRNRDIFSNGNFSEDKLYDIKVFGKTFEQVSREKINALQTFVWLVELAGVSDSKISFNKKSWLLYCEYYSEYNSEAEKMKDNCFIGLTKNYRVYDEDLSFLKS